MELGERIELLRKTVSGILFVLLLVSVFTGAFNVQPVKVSRTIYTSPGGSIDARRATQRDPVGALFNTQVRPVSAYSLTSHSPIFIGSDSEFVSANGVTEGSGTASNPYIIENWDIDASTTDGIIIVSTRAYFVIRNVVVHDGGSTYYGIWLWNVTNGEVLAVNTTRNCIGIAIDSSSGNIVSGSTAANNTWGVYLWSSNGIVVSGNKITNNRNNGITLDLSSSDNTVSGNEVTLNGYIGVALYSSSSSNTISGNTITSDNFGILLWASSSDNALFGNGITNTIVTGISFYSSSGNRFYHNNLVNNAFEDWSNNSTNAWDDGYPAGGNFWNDYIDGYPAGVDSFSGPYQNVTGSDRIGDTPYVIDVNNRDNYPFMNTTLLVPWIADPSNGTWVSGNAEIAAIEYDSSRIAGASFEYSKNALDWSLIGVDNNGTDAWMSGWNGTYRAQWNTTLVDEGWYYLRVTMHDAFGHFGQSAIQVYVDPTPPVPSITQPLDNSEIASCPTQLQATTQAEDVAGVVFAYLNVSNPDYEKPLTPLEQPDGKTCAPTAAASSLLWLAQHYPEAANLVTPEMINDPRILIEKLAKYMHTRENGFTTPEWAKKGITQYLVKDYYDKMHIADKEYVRFKGFQQPGLEEVETPQGKKVWKRVKPKGGWFSFFTKYVEQEDVLVYLGIIYPNGTVGCHVVTGMSFDKTDHIPVPWPNGPECYGVDFMDPSLPKGGKLSGYMDQNGNFYPSYPTELKFFVSDMLVLSPEKVFTQLRGGIDPYGWTVIGVNTDGRSGWTTTWDTSALPLGPYLLLAVMVDSAGNVASDIIWVELRGAWPMFHHDLTHTGYSTSAGSTTNNTLWTYTTGAQVISSSAVVGGFVYVGSLDDNVYCLDAANGSFVWSYTTGNAVYSSPAVFGGLVYVGSDDDNVYCLNAANGSLVWSYTTGDAVESSPAVVGGLVYVGSYDHNVYCLDAANGSLVWSYTTGDAVVCSSPAVAGGFVYVGSWDRKVYCLNAANGSLVWSYTTGGAVDSSPAVVGGFVYVGSDNVYCLNATTGSLVWSTTGGMGYSSPAVVGFVYVGSCDDNVYCLDAATGALVWNYTTGWVVSSSPAVAGGFVYVGSLDENVYCLDAATGAFVWSYTTGSYVESSPAVVDGVVYVGSADGKIYAFGSVHDVAVTNVTSSKTIVGQGFNANINVTVANQGSLAETFKITAYANATSIASQNITLSSGNSATITFTWNTTGFAKGNYTIWANALPVQGETDMADNWLTGGWVVVTWQGDLTDKDHLMPPGGVPDGKVDENDLWYFSGAFIDYYKIPSRLDANCDFNNDGKIDEDDLWYGMCAGFINYWKQH